MTSDAQGTIHPASGAYQRAGVTFARASSSFAGVGLPILITAAAAFIRFWRLGHPHEIIPLDETYYAPNSLGYLCHGSDMGFKANAGHNCAGLEPVFVVHPPVGKLLTAVGIKIFGYRPFGWRFAAAVVGSVSVLVVYLIARRLWEKRWAAVAAAVLVGVEGLQFVQSRIAMLDIFVSFFILVGVWLMLEDRARAPTWRGLRWWRIAAGAAFGLAIASKWSTLFMIPVVAAVMLAWDVVRIRDERPPPPPDVAADGAEADPAPAPRVRLARRVLRSIARDLRAGRRLSITFQLLALAGTFIVLPLLVYLASYTPWFLSTKRYVPPRCYESVAGKSVPKAGFDLWLCDQKEIADYHRNLKSTDEEGKPIHPYMSKAWSWPWISRPASHFYERYCAPGRSTQPCTTGKELRDEEILGLPNPLVWWAGFFVALPICAYWTIAKRDEVAGLLIVFLAPLVLPWFVTSRPLFMFYMTPASPLIVLMVVHMLQRWNLRWLAVWFVSLAVVLFGYFYPVLAAYPVAPTGPFGWESRIWFGHGHVFNTTIGDCTSKGVKLLCWI